MVGGAEMIWSSSVALRGTAKLVAPEGRSTGSVLPQLYRIEPSGCRLAPPVPTVQPGWDQATVPSAFKAVIPLWVPT